MHLAQNAKFLTWLMRPWIIWPLSTSICWQYFNHTGLSVPLVYQSFSYLRAIMLVLSAWNSFILSVITWGLFSLGFRLSTTFSGLLLFLIFFLFFFHSTYHNLYSFYWYVYFIACLYCTVTNMRAEVIYILFTIVDPALK